MPVWHETTREARKSGKLVVIGVIQEQHPERCRLFAQWKEFEWPIVQDPINLLGLRAVPIVVALDEKGVVRHVNPSPRGFMEKFLSTKKSTPKTPKPAESNAAKSPSIDQLRKAVAAAESDEDRRDSLARLADALLLWSGPEAAATRSSRVTQAIATYEDAIKIAPRDAALQFRLGVALRRRYDQGQVARKDTVKASDFGLAVEAWGRALELDPNHYIFRRRIQQYGPRLIKPYPFYDWIPLARKEIIARGDVPVALSVEPSGAEFARPSRRFTVQAGSESEPDPKARINQDKSEFIRATSVVVPAKIVAGRVGRLHLAFEPTKGAHWNNEAEPLVCWIELPSGWKGQQALKGRNPKSAESKERRRLEVELQAPPDAKGNVTLKAYALYYVCEERNGTCLYLRKDLTIPIQISNRSR